jgi:predicted enzyme related to lactoylglutathione lyase
MVQVVSLHINSSRPEALGAFYKAVLGLEPAWEGEGVTGFMVGNFRLEIAGHDGVSGRNVMPERLFFDLMVEDARAEFERLVGLGATAVQEPYDFVEGEMKLVIGTLADLDGNYFQVVSMG